jgi:hypothetical protein
MNPSQEITLRDYYAAHALEDDIAKHRGCKPYSDRSTLMVPEFTREEARFRFADAMLAARGDTQPRSDSDLPPADSGE